MEGTPSQCEEQAVEALLHAHGACAHGLTGAAAMSGAKGTGMTPVMRSSSTYSVSRSHWNRVHGWDVIPRIKYNIKHKCYMIALA